MGMFLLTLQKIPVSLSFIVTEIWPEQNTNLKSVFFLPKLKPFLHNFSRYVIYGIFFYFFPQKVLGDMVALHTDRRTDERMYIHEGKNTICLPQGRHIVIIIRYH